MSYSVKYVRAPQYLHKAHVLEITQQKLKLSNKKIFLVLITTIVYSFTQRNNAFISITIART